MSLLNRFLMFLVILVCIGLCGLWIIGSKKNEYGTSLLINAYPEQVFPYLVEPERLKQWVEGLDQVEKLMPVDDSKRRGTGATRRVVNQGGKQTEYQDEVLRYSEDKGVSVQSSNPYEVVVSVFQLEPEQGQTRLECRIKQSYVGVGRFLAVLKSDDMRSKMESDMQRLKALVEKNEPAPDAESEPVFSTPAFDKSSAVNNLPSTTTP